MSFQRDSASNGLDSPPIGALAHPHSLLKKTEASALNGIRPATICTRKFSNLADAATDYETLRNSSIKRNTAAGPPASWQRTGAT
jgi:hypothetical protein